LNQSAISLAIACDECHAVPTDVTHAALAISFSWGPLATSGGVTPVWNGSPSYTCTNYCHGATLPGGSLTNPNWTVVNGTQAACGTCHGVPPPSPHPAATLTQCHGCHSGTVNADGTINVAGGLHIDGTVEITGGTCTSCHGNPNIKTFPLDAAPPVDTLGNSVTTAPGVGAHQAHLVNTDLSASPVPCTECHVVPGDFTHSTEPLNLTWGPLATANGAVPTWNSTTYRCSNYCHGQTLHAGGSNTTPTWTIVNGTQDACGTCHGIPPPASTGHTQSTACGDCHCGYTTNAYVGMPENGATINLGDHINGQIDVDCE
jgi:predicted CxxxxCH...CXXCH cytochrome family protein